MLCVCDRAVASFFLCGCLMCSAGQTPRKVRHLCAGEQMDVYCSQCCKKVNLLNDLEARLKNLKSNRYTPYTLACTCIPHAMHVVHACMCALYTYMHACMYVVHTCMYVCTHRHVCGTNMHVCGTHMHVCGFHMHVCVYTHACRCTVHTCMCTVHTCMSNRIFDTDMHVDNSCHTRHAVII